jgi:hypothetical protein
MCDGAGRLSVIEDRREKQPSWGKVIKVVVGTAIVVAMVCLFILDRAGAWRSPAMSFKTSEGLSASGDCKRLSTYPLLEALAVRTERLK